MDSIILGSLLEVVFDKLSSPILQEVHFVKNFKKEILKLQNLLPAIRTVIADAETRQESDPVVSNWLSRLQHVLYDADDLFDELNTKALQRQMKNKVRISSINPFPGHFTTSRQLKDIFEKFGDIGREMSAIQLIDKVVCRRYKIPERVQTGPYLEESRVIGRENDVRRIVEMLVSPSSSSCSSRSENVSVISIVAMAGIGKTTLAQLAYNDPRVKQHFTLQIWICVSDNFNVRKLINDILDYTSEGIRQLQEFSQLGVLQTQLQESLRGKRYLIVLDDVWSENEEEWDKLRIPLRCGADGSKILVTTRSQSVASIMGTMTSYRLVHLAHDDCRTLFKQYAFAEGEEEAYPNLVSIGEEIVNKCGGVPLALKILGSMMSEKREERQWSDVSTLRNMGDTGILRTLKLSYDYLPSYLKQCFSYLSVFPKNYVIKKEKLIHQWIAEGLIKSPGDAISSKKMEDTANEYFNDLMSKFFFQVVTKCDDADGVITEFKLHNLVHDLALSVAGDDVLTMTDNSPSPENILNARRATLECSFHTSQNLQQVLSKAKKLRTINMLPACPRGELVDQVITLIRSHQRRLRVLNVSGCNIEKLHKSIGGLIHLRFLDLSNTPITKIPEHICHLFNLHTLNLSGCNDLMELPIGISNLINLRHLNIKDCTSLTHMPGNIKNLRNLQTLSFFIVGLTLEESLFQLVDLDLRGELEVKCLENVRNLLPGLCLAHKQLHSMGLSWGNKTEGKLDHRSSRQTAERNHGQNADNVLACLQPNCNLRKLSISEYSGEVFPPWMNNVKLRNLTKLVLIDCRRCKDLPTLGQLPFLEVLNMQGMDAVVKISSEFYGKIGKTQPFQSLNELNLRDFPELGTWERMDGAEAFPCLNRLTITKCSKLLNMPWFPSLQHLELHECNATILMSVKELNSLSTLVIESFPELHSLPEELLQNNSLLTSLTVSYCPRIASMPASLGNLEALRSLTIRWCEKLETLPDELRNLTYLQTLEIVECGRLTSLPEEGMKGLNSLRSFSIENCYNLTSLPKAMKHLKALEHLRIMYCPSLDCLPDGLQQIATLRSLSIVSCPELVSLPEGLQHVKMLQNLEIRSCPKLTELPEWVENFLSLQSLAISDVSV